MSSRTFEQVTIRDLVRLPSSRNGNPRYVIVGEDHRQFTTAPDSGFAYELPNHIGTAMILWLNSRGHVVSGTVNHLGGAS